MRIALPKVNREMRRCEIPNRTGGAPRNSPYLHGRIGRKKKTGQRISCLRLSEIFCILSQMRKSVPIILNVFVMFLAGCLYQWENPYFVVKPSGLNVVNIRQHYTTGHLAGYHVSLRITGNGTVVVREGTSALVSNAFANDPKGDRWGDVRERRIPIAEEDANQIFQALVNSGLFAKHTFSPGNVPANETSMIYVGAKIQNKTTSSTQAVTDPKLLETLKTTVMLFYNPRPVRRPILN